MVIITVSVGLSVHAAGVTEVWSTPEGLNVPESVMYDQSENILYVSNINGKPTEKNNKGFISKVTLNGKIENLKWITGMNAPKGMGINGNTLYVTDIDRIHAIDIKAGRIAGTYELPEAKFLNDIAVCVEGNVFITDMMTQKIYVLKNGRLSLWVDLSHYKKPNGLYMQEPYLFVGTAQGLLKIHMINKIITMEIPHTGGIDGLRKVRQGPWIVSDWNGKTQLIKKDGKPEVLLDTTRQKINAADLEYIPEKKLILIPTFFDHKVVAYRLKF